MQFQIINASETEKYKYWTEVRPVIKVYYTLTTKAVPYADKYGAWAVRDILHCEVYETKEQAQAAIMKVALHDKVSENRVEVIRHERQEDQLVRCRRRK